MIPIQKKVAAYGPHGLGKTAIEALAILWFSTTRNYVEEEEGADWKIPSTASVWRQLEKFLWPEVRKWSRRIRWKEMGIDPWSDHELLTLSIKLRNGEAFALASDDPESIEGAHANHLLYTFDESKAIMASVWDAAEGAFASGDVYAFACSTPGEESGRFYEICSRKAGYEDWAVRHVTIDEAIAAGRVSEAWVKARVSQWGEGSPVFRNRVRGEFASSDSTGVIPLAWVEAATDRWAQQQDQGLDIPFTCLGVDVGGGGNDQADLSVLVYRAGYTVTDIRRAGRQDTMETAGAVGAVLSRHGGYALVDSIGIGAGVVARLREMDFDVVPFNAAEGAGDARDSSGELGFANKRAWAWWNLRELLDPGSPDPIALPPDDLLIGDLTAPRWRIQSGGRILVESKDDIRKRIGRSTDTGDAVVMAFSSQRVPTASNTEPVTVANLNEYETRRTIAEDTPADTAPVSGLWEKVW